MSSYVIMSYQIPVPSVKSVLFLGITEFYYKMFFEYLLHYTRRFYTRCLIRLGTDTRIWGTDIFFVMMHVFSLKILRQKAQKCLININR